MFDSQVAIEIAFEAISKFETIEKIDKGSANFDSQFCASWSIFTEVEINGITTEIRLYICFPDDFPFAIPKIYLSEEDFNRFGYFPHLDSNRFICTFRDDTTLIDFGRPDVIVFDCITNAKKVIRNGLNKTNLDDFTDEFAAYWNQNYMDETRPNNKCISFFSSKPLYPQIIKFCKFCNPLGKYYYCLCQDEVELEALNNNLSLSGNKAVEISEILLFSEFPRIIEKPPYRFTYNKTFEIVESMEW